MYREDEGAALLYVRTPEEYRRERVPESVNLPMRELDWAQELFPERDTALYVYAYGGDGSEERHLG